MADNFYIDNPDIRFQLKHVDIKDIVELREEDYKQADEFADAPESLEDAIDSYDKVLEMVGAICGDFIAPRAEDVDKEGASLENGVVSYAQGTQENLDTLTKAQLMGVMLPRKYGGLNMPVTIYTMMTEMVSRADASLQNLFGLQDIAETISKFGDEDQKQRYLPRFASGEADGAMALTEPEAGSDLQSVQLKAHFDPEKNQWFLNGMKRFITNGCAKVQLVLARSEDGSKDGRGLSMFVCERGPNLVVRRIEDKLGIHGSPTCELQFNNVPAELVGKRKRGLTRYVMSLMNGARVAISGQALGIAEAAYREALKYAQEREQFGRAIIKFPAVYDMLVNSKVDVIAGRTLLYETTKYVDLRDSYEEANNHAEERDPESIALEKKYTKIAAALTPLAKAYCTEMANKVAYDCIQIHGGTGYMRDFPAERLYRDARITNIYEGTTQLQYVAAIGGVVQGVLDPIMDELSHLPYEGKLRRLASSVDIARDRFRRAVDYVEEHSDTDYFGLVSAHLCEMQIAIFVSYLMLKDALHDRDRAELAEVFISRNMPKVEMLHEKVTSGNVTVIDNYEKILGI